MLSLFLAEAYVVIAGCLGYRSAAWAAAWLPVYPVARVLVASASLDELVLGIAVAFVAGFAAAIGSGLRPTTGTPST